MALKSRKGVGSVIGRGLIPDAHLLNQALEDQTNTVSLVSLLLNRGSFLSEKDKVRYRKIALGKRREPTLTSLIINTHQTSGAFFANGF